MARTFRRRRQMHAVSELNVTNLVDLAFVLLIVFMLAAPLLDAPPSRPFPLTCRRSRRVRRPRPIPMRGSNPSRSARMAAIHWARGP